jgi:hypothetical protein
MEGLDRCTRCGGLLDLTRSPPRHVDPDVRCPPVTRLPPGPVPVQPTAQPVHEVRRPVLYNQGDPWQGWDGTGGTLGFPDPHKDGPRHG